MVRRIADAADAVDAAHLIAATTALVGKQAASSARFGIAVSGGGDSLALLLLAHRAFPGRVAAATVDHGLRPNSHDEATQVARWCGEIGVPHAILTPTTPITGSLQAAARTARYALLDAWRASHGLGWVMTAHHADDQAETLVMRLNRGSGVAGLAGVRAVQGAILRPLLGMRRADLADIVHRHGWHACDDPSNRDDRFDRARVRKALGTAPVIDPIAATRSAMALSDAEEALAWSTGRLLHERSRQHQQGWSVDMSDLPHEYRRRLLIAALAALEPDRAPPRSDTLCRAIAMLEQGLPAMIGNTQIKPAKTNPTDWHLHVAPPRTAR